MKRVPLNFEHDESFFAKKMMSTVASRLLETQKRLKRDRERGDTFILYFMLFPVMFAFFGLAVDVAAANYTAGTLQSALDTATQSAVAQSQTTASKAPTLTLAQAKEKIYHVYDANRTGNQKIPFLACQGTNVPYANSQGQIRPTSNCGFTVNSISVTPTSTVGGKVVRNVVKVSVTEYSKYMFLYVIGMEYQKYNITSQAFLTTGRGA